MKKSIYIVQFGTGTNINLLPLAAGQLYSRLRREADLQDAYNLEEIVFRREDPEEFAERLNQPAVIGFSCFLWNLDISIKCAAAVRQRYPESLIVVGGPSVPKDPSGSEAFLKGHPQIDAICVDEGEEVFTALCRAHHDGVPPNALNAVSGIIYVAADGETVRTDHSLPDLAKLPSPYLDGTFDRLYERYGSEFSGAVLETNRGCPFSCVYCTWGHLQTKRIREKPLQTIRQEIDWIGRHGIRYVAMCDSNFGISEQDVVVAEVLAETKRRHGNPSFASVSWVKNSSSKVVRLSRILQEAGVGFRVTLSLQSLKPEVIEAVKRSNLDHLDFRRTRTLYRANGFFSYTELILGLPLETESSFLEGLEECLSPSIFEQLYVYPCFLFPNTELATHTCRERYGIVSRIIPNRYTKSKELVANDETVEVVVGTAAMPPDAWIRCFVKGYLALALHDDRLLFFVARYLKDTYDVLLTDIVEYAWNNLGDASPVVGDAFCCLESTARAVQERGASHLIEPKQFDIPFDPPEGVFLELLINKREALKEFQVFISALLQARGHAFDQILLDDLFRFQEAVLAHPDGPSSPECQLSYNWTEYFGFVFGLTKRPLMRDERCYAVVDRYPSGGNRIAFLKNHFDVRGCPPFNELMERGGTVFPPSAPEDETNNETADSSTGENGKLMKNTESTK